MKYNELIKDSIKKLEEHKIDPKLATYLATHYIKFSELDKFNKVDLNNNLLLKYNKAITRLIKGEPIQYIIGSVNFFGYPFKLSKSVLIPRFETEELVDNTIKYIKHYFNGNLSIVDVGTGSGVIGITLKKELINSEVTITDISKKALKIAAYNAEHLDAKVKILNGNMLNPLLEQEDKFDVLISNPPYIKNEEKTVEDIVFNNEPHIALYGGKDGLKFYHKILESASKILKHKSMIALEIGADEAEDIISIVKKYFPNSTYEIKKDLSKRDRMLFIFNNLND